MYNRIIDNLLPISPQQQSYIDLSMCLYIYIYINVLYINVHTYTLGVFKVPIYYGYVGF